MLHKKSMKTNNLQRKTEELKENKNFQLPRSHYN